MIRKKYKKIKGGVKMSNLIEHAEREFNINGWLDNDDKMNKLMMRNVKELLMVFSEQGHSGFSAPIILDIFNKLARFEFIGKLTGEDSEWNKCEGGVYQSNRYSQIFKEGINEQAYDIEGKVFSDDNGDSWYTSVESRVNVEFPCTLDDLKPEYIIIK